MGAVSSPRCAGSPSSSTEPLAFTGDEYLRGAILALLSFTLLFPFATLLVPTVEMVSGSPPPNLAGLLSYLPVAMGYAGLVATAVWVIYGGPLAYLLGRLLRRRPNRWLHRCAFATLGAAVGASGSALFLAPLLAEGAPWPLELIVPATVCAAICVWGGWEFTSSRAHRRDLDPAVQRFGDDEAAEDAAVDRISRVEEPPPPES